MSIEDTLSSLKRKIELVNNKKIENQTKLQSLEDEKQKLLAECQLLGVDPQALERIVVEEETKLNIEVQKLEGEINTVYSQLEKF
jgi:predicted  nucleic acid-binding Zn-ribbon protein